MSADGWAFALEHKGLAHQQALHWYSMCEGRHALGDLVQEAFIGLMIAGTKYDPSKGRPSTYAMHWIKQRIRRFIKHDCVVRVPESSQQLLNNKSLAQAIRQRPRSKWTLIDVHRATRRPIMRFQRPKGENGAPMDLGWQDPREPSDAQKMSQETERQFLEVLGVVLDEDHLSERERNVIRWRFWQGETLAQIGTRLELSRERVRQIIVTAQKRLLREMERHMNGGDA